jgi:hypothetical protein
MCRQIFSKSYSHWTKINPVDLKNGEAKLINYDNYDTESIAIFKDEVGNIHSVNPMPPD